MGMADSDQRAAVIAAVKAQFRNIARDHATNLEQLAELQRQAAAIQEDQRWLGDQARRCYATADLFNFDLATELAKDTPAMPNEMEAAAIAGELASPAGQPTIKEFILEQARLAAPKPVRATQMRKDFEARFGKPVHYKSFGMSLYRLSLDGAMRREGKADWHFVPEDQREHLLELIRMGGVQEPEYADEGDGE